MKLVFSLYLSHIRIFKERSDKSQKSTFDTNAHFQVLTRKNVFDNESSNSCGSSSAG
ncbi:hypothetical protein YSA_06231 [Pseudomonas putida ND6]|uniref:Uncharacterized protein n=1 Tax=Pseudomonas putida ND6 TaxID=231023 RepID=I3UXB3_PSEPU|nr:hypothetical protein YSA_05295 [Pseudomonas putida ND6]AFK70134.1 hypothetical protein YSA_06231 [Pseudomonas putida ND6]